MEVLSKPACKFGAKCYRKNPKHFDTYSHPDRSQSVKERTSQKKDRKIVVQTNSKKNSSFKRKAEQTTLGKNTVEAPVDKCEEALVNVQKRPKTDKRITKEPQDKLTRSPSKKSKRSPDSSSASINTGVPMTSLASANSDSDDATVDMPTDFYSFYEFYKSVEQSQPLELAGLKLAGPFSVLSGEMKYSIDPDLFLCHWRYYYDPPEFQTVLITDSGFHIGYWRDEPTENPVFLASNNPNKNCLFKVEAENIFGTVFHYLNGVISNTDPFKKLKVSKLQIALSNWAKKNNFSVEKKTAKMDNREKKVVSKTFHGAGIVVPLEAKTEVGYRPLIETDDNLKKICKLIMNASDDSEKEGLWENLQPLINAANIANDECDFGNSLELGLDLFCMGSPVFHDTVEHLLSTAYSLLNRCEFEKIIKAHLKYRRKGNNLSVCN